MGISRDTRHARVERRDGETDLLVRLEAARRREEINLRRRERICGRQLRVVSRALLVQACCDAPACARGRCHLREVSPASMQSGWRASLPWKSPPGPRIVKCHAKMSSCAGQPGQLGESTHFERSGGVRGVLILLQLLGLLHEAPHTGRARTSGHPSKSGSDRGDKSNARDSYSPPPWTAARAQRTGEGAMLAVRQ